MRGGTARRHRDAAAAPRHYDDGDEVGRNLAEERKVLTARFIRAEENEGIEPCAIGETSQRKSISYITGTV